MKMKILFFTIVAAALITGCERVDVADQYEYKFIPPTSSYNSNVESYWKFDTATRVDLNSKTGTTFMMQITGNCFTPSGKFNEAYQPSASDGYYMCFINSSPVLYDSERFLVEAWVKPASTSGTQAVFSKCNTAAPAGWSCRLNGGHPEIWYGIDGVTEDTVTSVDPALIVPADGNWHYIAYVFSQQTNSSSGKNIYFYVDGNSERVDLDYTCQNSPTNLNFGYEMAGTSLPGSETNYFNGAIDDLAYWSLPEFISWDSIEETLARRNDGLQYGTTKMLFY